MKLVLLCMFTVLVLVEPAAAKKKDKDQVPDGTVSVIQDERIVESSGLALSSLHEDLVYTVNDRGTHPMVYAVQVSTGNVVGATDVSTFDVEDTESIAVDANGTLWLGDLGDNDGKRDNVSIVAFPEPGPGDHHLTSAARYGVTFPNGPVDVEGMLVDPSGGQVHLVSKNRNGLGALYRVSNLTPGTTAVAEDLQVEVPQAVTDAAFTNDGRVALLRTEDDVWIYDATTWQPVNTVETPKLQQGESITVERGDTSILLGSEGKKSPLVRVALPNTPSDAPPLDLDSKTSADGASSTALELAGGLLLLLGVIAYVTRRRNMRVHA